MWPGMRPATGWMAYFTSTPSALRLVGHLAQLRAGLRHRHAVAGTMMTRLEAFFMMKAASSIWPSPA